MEQQHILGLSQVKDKATHLNYMKQELFAEVLPIIKRKVVMAIKENYSLSEEEALSKYNSSEVSNLIADSKTEIWELDENILAEIIVDGAQI